MLSENVQWSQRFVADADSLKYTGLSFHAVSVEPVNEDT
jgi:hypothetical protein